MNSHEVIPYDAGSAFQESPTAIVVYQPETTPQRMLEIRQQQLDLVERMMVVGTHYGRIPGTPKPSLWQPGAQLLDVLHGFAPVPHLIEKVEDHASGFFSYTVRVDLMHRRSGTIAGSGLGSCNSMEKRYREAKYHDADHAGQPVDPHDILNTLLKMATKRAHIAATLNATGLTDFFTQDLEDMPGQQQASSGADAEYGLCPIHHVALRKGQYGVYCPVKVKGADGKERWCKGLSPTGRKAAAPQQKAPPAGEAGPARPASIPTRDDINNLGQLFTASHNVFGLSQSETLDALGKTDKMDIVDPGEEWERLVERYAEQGDQLDRPDSDP